MIAECVCGFRDLEAKAMRKAGDRFEVTPERFKALNATKYGILVREVPEEPKQEEPKPRARRTRKTEE